MVDICLLGCGGMMPLPERRLSAALYRYNGRIVLIDCGEGTQVSIMRSGWRFKSVDAICLTHYHADHVAGLPGLLLTMANNGREQPVHLYGPPGLTAVVNGLTVITPGLSFELILTELPDTRPSGHRMGDIILKSLPVEHTSPCLAYCLEIERAGKFDTERAEKYGIPLKCWNRLQHGETIEDAARRYTPDMVLGAPRKGLKIVYCTDTRPTSSLIPFCTDTDLLICEGLYGDEKKQSHAREKKHMVFSEAAALAKESRTKELWLTHYSPSVSDPALFIAETRQIFKNTVPGRDMMMKTLFFEDG